MSRLLARIMLAILLFPLAAVVYLVVVVSFMMITSYRNEMVGFLLAGILTWVFLGLYWFLLWRRSVLWTPPRVRWTLLSLVIALIGGVLAGATMTALFRFAGRSSEDGFSAFVGSVIAPLSWLVMTVLIWCETAAERAARLSGAKHNALVCPTCGYNLTGLSESRCPECGTRFTLDELLASQPHREPTEIE